MTGTLPMPMHRVCDNARDIGDLLLSTRRGCRYWTDKTRRKSAADAYAHEAWVHWLAEATPHIPVVSEEALETQSLPRPGTYWLLDPLDGTASYVGGYDGFVTQIAYMVDCHPVWALVYAPASRDMYVAELGRGAFCNGTRIYASGGGARTLIDNTPSLSTATLPVFNALNLTHYIECGSIGLKMCKVADGTADVFVKPVYMYDWDIAAPSLILSEAGGSMAYMDSTRVPFTSGYGFHGIVAANSEDIMLKLNSITQECNHDQIRCQ